MLEKKCSICNQMYPIDNFRINDSKGRRRSSCNKCTKERANLNYRKRNPERPKFIKYSSDEERKQAARKRASEWYRNNTDRAKQRTKEWAKRPEVKERIKLNRIAHRNKNPEWFRQKKKRDKVSRRCRELSAGRLDVSSLVELEHHNISYFKNSMFTCEHCETIISGVSYHLDHLTPLSKNGTNDLTNLSIMCPGCNLSKGSKDLIELSKDFQDYIAKRNSKWKT